MSDFIRECIEIYKKEQKREAEKKERYAIKWAKQATELFRKDFGVEPNSVKAKTSAFAHIFKNPILFVVRPYTDDRYEVIFRHEGVKYQHKLINSGDYKYELGKFLEGKI